MTTLIKKLGDVLVKKDARFAQVLVSVAGEMFSWPPEGWLKLADGHDRWPEAIRGLLFNEDLVTLHDELPTWVNPKRLIIIDPATFRAEAPPPPARRELLDREGVLAYLTAQHGLNFTDEQFDDALTLGFPNACSTRYSVDGNGASAMSPLWSQTAVDTWAGRQSRLKVTYA
jgi:hypothetical protein